MKKLLITIIFITLCYLANGQTNTREIDTSLPVGSTAGEASVTGNGEASYSLPVFVSPGTAGMQPNISIEYNSQAGNGFLGIGWNINGLSTISRTPQNTFINGKVQEIRLNANDRFALDGNQLIVTNNGAYGANSTEYHTQAESFFKITSYGASGTGPRWFKVETKDGITREYGNSANSYRKASDKNEIISWHLSKVSDNKGNYITYTYHSDNTKGEFWIEKIDYTGTTTFAPYNSLNFYYESREDVNFSFVAGTKSVHNVILSKITAVNEGHTVRSYEFKYAKDLYSHLNEIIEYGSDGSRLNSTVVNWGAEKDKLLTTTANINGNGYRNYPGDFNGDGRTDMLVVLQFEYKWKLYLANSSGNLEFKSENILNEDEDEFSDIIVADVNSDGIDDVIMQKHRVHITTICEPCELVNRAQDSLTNATDSLAQSPLQVSDAPDSTGVIVNTNSGDPDECCHDEEYDWEVFEKYFFNGTTLQYITEEIYYKYAGNVVHIKDFDGDGKQEFMFVNGTTKNFTSLTGLQLNTLPVFNSPKDIRFIDFNGNGKTDIMLVGNRNCKIIEYDSNSLSFKEIAAYDMLSAVPFYTGDFNGDGKTDVLYYDQIEWVTMFSNGVTFSMAPHKMYPGSENSTYIVDDFNGDGKDDFLETYRAGTGSDINIYYSNGNGFIEESFSVTQSLRDLSRCKFGDFNGDGKKDIIFQSYNNEPEILLFFHKDEAKHLVQSITNGLNATVSFSYLPLSQGTAPFYTRGQSVITDVWDYQGPSYVVSSVTKPNGIGGNATTSYQYAGATTHIKGNGYLGFSRVTEIDNTTSLKVINDFAVNNTWFISVKTKTQVMKTDNSPVTEDNFATQFIDYGNKRYFAYTSLQSNVDYMHANTTTTTNYQYNTDGNLISISSNIGGINTATTTNTYITAGAWCPNRLQTTTTTRTRTGENSFTTSSGYEYYSDGFLKQIIKEPGNSQKIYTNYIYDDFGNITETKISPDGITGRKTNFSYDEKKRMIKSSTNALGHFIEMENDYGFGVVLETKDHNNLVASNQYDAFGRLKQTTAPDGNVSAYSYHWVTGSSPAYAVYYTEAQIPGTPSVKTYFDIYGRAVCTEKTGFDGRKVFVNTKYNIKGQVDYVTLPYFEGESDADRMVYTYDNLGRLSTETGPGVNKSYVYNGLTTTITDNIAQQTYSRTADAAGNLVSTTDQGGSIGYTYYSSGLVKAIAAPAKTITMTYDQFGRQTQLSDPDAGTYDYTYNNYGELATQTDPQGRTTTLAYDDIGRLNTQTGGTFNTTYNYKTNGWVDNVTSTNNITYSYTYDNLGRTIAKTENINGSTFITGYGYNTEGRISQITYPSGFIVDYVYQNGYLKTIKRNDSGKTIWSLSSVNAKDQLTGALYGNTLTNSRSYDSRGFIQTMRTGSGNGIQNLEYHFNSKNLLDCRKDNRHTLTENFGYDNLDRLNSIQVGSGTVNAITYAAGGNIQTKFDAGAYSYETSQPNAVSQVSNPGFLISGTPQAISYTTFNKVATINEGINNATFTYGPDNSRKMVVTNGVGASATKYYSDTYEKEVTGSVTRELHYIFAYGETVAIFEKKTSGDAMHYVHTDHLGSLNVLTNESGAIEQELSFDAWGNRRDPATWQNLVTTPTGLITDRGFTGHEHMDAFKLINMNGRCYDPLLGRFLSPDPYLQNPANTQGYNRYSYCINNPLMFIDPSGYIFELQDHKPDSENPFWFGYTTYGGSGSITPHIDAGKDGEYSFDYCTGTYRNGLGQKVSYEEVHKNYVLPRADMYGVRVETYIQVGEGKYATGTSYKGSFLVWRDGGGGNSGSWNSMTAVGALALTGEAVASTALASALIATLPLVVSGDTRQNEQDYSYVVYLKTNTATGQVYVGRTSGPGTPQDVLKRRDSGHDYNKLGFGPAIVHSALINVGGAIGYPAMRGREQQVIDSFGGIGSPLLANKIRGVAMNRIVTGRFYWTMSNLNFGPLAPYSGY